MRAREAARSIPALFIALALVACDRAPEAPKADSASVTAAPASPKAEPAPQPAPQSVPSAPPAAQTAAPDDTVLARFKADGSSPAWSAEINGDTLRFEVPETMGPDVPKRTIKVERLAYAKGVNYDGVDGATPFTLDLRGKECTQTGGKREFTATFTYGQSTYHGCADALR